MSGTASIAAMIIGLWATTPQECAMAQIDIRPQSMYAVFADKGTTHMNNYVILKESGDLLTLGLKNPSGGDLRILNIAVVNNNLLMTFEQDKIKESVELIRCTQ